MVKPFFRKLLSAVLSAALLIGNLPAYASDALGRDLAARSTALHEGTELADGTFWSDTYSDLRQENYVVYTPNERVTPVVTYGETSRALTTVTAAARELEAQGLRVAAGINGDYYDTQYGLPIGSTMTDGALRNVSSDPYYAVGFRADGTAVIGDPHLSLRATVNGESGFAVYAFNYLRLSDYGIFLYDHNFNARHTTGTSETGVDVICSVADGALTIGGTLTLTVDEVLPEATNTEVPEGKYILTANLRSTERYTAPLLALAPGDELTLTVVSDAENAEDWNDVVQMVGAPHMLVENGEVVGGLPTGSAPRTAIGQREDGSLIFYTIDGRQAGYSIGATLSAVAMRLVELGCVSAVALDGGGSTTMLATLPNETAARIVNLPSDGSARAVSNHILLVSDAEPSGELDHVYLAASAHRALPGASLTLTAAAIDTNYIPMDAPVALETDAGSLTGNTLTLPDETGTVTVTAKCGDERASVEITVTEPERILVKRDGSTVSSLTVPPDSKIALKATGIENHLTLPGGNGCFTWTYEGSGAEVTPDGTLLTGSNAAAGTLSVSLGGQSVTIPVTVSVLPLRLLDDFEAPFEPISDADDPEAQPQLTLSHETSAAQVKLGKASARLDYAISYAMEAEADEETGENEDEDAEPITAPLTLPLSYAVPSGYSELTLWACGDGNPVSLAAETNVGSSEAVALEEGWTALTLPLPSGTRRITGVTLRADAEVSGALWLDQLVLNYGKVDDAAPEVSLSLDDEALALTGFAFDAVNGSSLSVLRLCCDGTELAYDYDTRTGALSAALPEADGFAHRVTLTAGDAAGQLARASLDLPAAEDADAAFPDTAGHWANHYIAYLKRAGISNGSGDLYLPDTNITRQEFAVMLYRYLAPAEDEADGAELPFVDREDVAGWAVDAVQAMYRLGVVNGAPDGAGKLRFNPRANISRQEAATMVGRLLDKGWGTAELTFADSDAIPAWAAEHIRTLAALGILNGYEDGTFRPAAPLTRAQIAAMLFRLN